MNVTHAPTYNNNCPLTVKSYVDTFSKPNTHIYEIWFN
jgi:FMN-dependent NADH-azoreductase